MFDIFLLFFFITLVFVLLIIYNKKSKYKNIYRQSSIHAILRHTYTNTKKEKISQSTKRSIENKINVIVLEDMAYWIENNVFYSSDIKNGKPIVETAKPVDTKNMSKKELDKMLFIVDNLTRGD